MTITKEDIARYFAVDEEILSGGNLRSFRITHIHDDRVRIQPTQSKTPSRLHYNKLQVVVEFFGTIDQARIERSVGDLLRANDLQDTQNESYLYGFAREYIARRTKDSLEFLVASDLQAQEYEGQLEEGGKIQKLVSVYERNPQVRLAAIKVHGTTCKACGFNFGEAYGNHGKDYIEVHHLVPISTFIEPASINPETDLTVLCSNCHRMAHRKRDEPLSLTELQKLWQMRYAQ